MKVNVKLGWREMRQHPGRAILTLLSIVIGVAAVVAVTLTTQTTRRAFDDIYQTIAGRAALEVAGPIGTSFDENLLPVKGLPTRTPPHAKSAIACYPFNDEREEQQEGQKQQICPVTF